MSQSPAGWYPQSDGRQRYWDGQQWTEQFAPGQDGPAPTGQPAVATVGEQKRANAHLAGVDEEAFAGLRAARDRTLPMPKLILHALQVNIQAGRLPEPEANGTRYLKFPLDALQGAVW